MSDEHGKDDEGKRPDPTSDVVERYGRRGGSARREGKQPSGFWRKLFTSDAGATEADSSAKASEKARHEREELSEDVGLDWDDESVEQRPRSKATGKAPSAPPLGEALASPQGRAMDDDSFPAVADRPGRGGADSLVPLPPLPPLADDSLPVAVPLAAEAESESFSAMASASPEPRSERLPVERLAVERLAIELVLPDASRLLLVATAPGGTRNSGLLSLVIEEVPVNGARVIKGLQRLAAEVAAASTSPGDPVAGAAGVATEIALPPPKAREIAQAPPVAPSVEAPPPPVRSSLGRETAESLDRHSAKPTEDGVRALSPLKTAPGLKGDDALLGPPGIDALDALRGEGTREPSISPTTPRTGSGLRDDTGPVRALPDEDDWASVGAATADVIARSDQPASEDDAPAEPRRRKPRRSAIQRGGAAATATGDADPMGRWTEDSDSVGERAQEEPKPAPPKAPLAPTSGGEPATPVAPPRGAPPAPPMAAPAPPKAPMTPPRGAFTPPEGAPLTPPRGSLDTPPKGAPLAPPRGTPVAPVAATRPPEPPRPVASEPPPAARSQADPIFSGNVDSLAVSGTVDAPGSSRVPRPPSAPVVVKGGLPAETMSRLPAAPRAEADGPHDAPEIAPPDASDEGAPGLSLRRARKMAPVVGIDFGTSYSCVALLRAGLELISGPDDEVMIPSVVSFPSEGEVIVGAEAKRRMGGEAQWTIASPKRLLGRPYKDPQVGSLLGTLAMRTFAGTDQFTRFEAHGQIYSVTDICAMILGKLRERACRYLDADVTKAVFAVPVAYGSLQRSALELAAKQAGLQGVALLTEPSAALLAHGFRGRRGMAAVYDFGGGTFDFCVVDITETAFRVVCAGGDPWLGGDDFDTALGTMVADRFWKDSGIDLRTRAVEWQALVHACEKTKRELSVEKAAFVEVENLVHTAQGAKGLKYKIARKDFVRSVEDLIDRSINITGQIMAQAGVDPKKVDQIVMTGGTSMIPAIRDAVTKLFGKKPLTGDSELAVVRGTALRAAELSGEAMGDTSMSGRTLREVAGRTIGVGTEGSGVVTIFERNTPLPAEVQHSFNTVRPNQTDMVVTLYEGAKSRVDERQVLGQLRYRGLRAAPAGKNKVDFTFILDEDGLLHVTAVVEGRVFDKTIKLG